MSLAKYHRVKDEFVYNRYMNICVLPAIDIVHCNKKDIAVATNTMYTGINIAASVFVILHKKEISY